MRLKVSPRARRMRLSVDPRTRSVLLTVPRRVSQRRALAWASGHRAWIEQALADIPPPLAFAPGAIGPALRRAASDRLGCRAAAADRAWRGAAGRGRPARRARAADPALAEGRGARSARAARPREFAARAGVTAGAGRHRRSGVALGQLLEHGRDPLQLAADPGARFRPPRHRRARGRAPRPPQSRPRFPRFGRGPARRRPHARPAPG